MRVTRVAAIDSQFQLFVDAEVFPFLLLSQQQHCSSAEKFGDRTKQVCVGRDRL